MGTVALLTTCFILGVMALLLVASLNDSANSIVHDKRDAILTAIRGYSVSVSSVFVRSWFKNVDNSELFIFTEIRPNTKQLWANHFPREEKSGRLHILNFNYSLWTFNEFQMDRHVIYHDFLKRYPNRFRYVMTSDIRDVAFQSNPFENPFFRNYTTAPIIFAQEDVFFGHELYNEIWIREVFGEDAFPDFIGKQISNSGVVMGPAASMMDYLRLLTTILPANYKHDGGMDQGVHNYLLYEILHKSLVKPFNYVVPSNGLVVFTVGSLSGFEEILGWNETLKVIFRQRWELPPPPVVHQFDRNSFLDSRFKEMYAN